MYIYIYIYLYIYIYTYMNTYMYTYISITFLVEQKLIQYQNDNNL